MKTEIRLNGTSFRYWWISLIVGLLSITTGVCCFVASPIDSLEMLSGLFVAILLVGGVFNMVAAAANRRWNDCWGWDLARGIVEVMFGVWLCLLPPALATVALVYVFGLWMLFHSVMGICESGLFARLHLRGWGWLLACNILSLLCSFLFLVTPVVGGLFVLAYVGISFVLYGVFRIVLAFEMRHFNRS